MRRKNAREEPEFKIPLIFQHNKQKCIIEKGIGVQSTVCKGPSG
jgi:hypothetical protein